tara:strand:+ start:163 stop:393 length:231 start_codon:yes stop_codon:yes gene_type:complete
MNKTITIELIVDSNTERDHRIFKDGSTIEQYIENAITSTLEDDMIAVSSIVTEDEALEEDLVYLNSNEELSKQLGL